MNPIQVRIHNIRSGRPEPEIEILYAVYQDEKVFLFRMLSGLKFHPCVKNGETNERMFLKNLFPQDPVLAVEAVKVVDENVDQDQAVLFEIFLVLPYIFWIFLIPLKISNLLNIL